MGRIFKKNMSWWVSICCLSLAQVGWSEEMSKEELQERFEELKLDYLQKVDPLRYQFHTRTGKFADYNVKPFSPSYNFVEWGMYSSASAVYGKVMKTESGKARPPHTVVYIKPYRCFKDVVTDSNGYVVVREYGYGGVYDSVKKQSTEYFEFGSIEKHRIGEEVVIFLNDISRTLDIKEVVKSGTLHPTSDQHYYESQWGRGCASVWAATVKNDTIIEKDHGPLLATGPYKYDFQKIPLSKAIKIMEQIETEYKEAKKIDEGGEK